MSYTTRSNTLKWAKNGQQKMFVSSKKSFLQNFGDTRKNPQNPNHIDMHHHTAIVIAAAGTAGGALLAILFLLFFQLIGYNVSWLHWVIFGLVGAGIGLFCSIRNSEEVLEKYEIKEHFHAKRKLATAAPRSPVKSPSRRA